MIHFSKVCELCIQKKALYFCYFICENIVTLKIKNMVKEKTTYLKSKLKLELKFSSILNRCEFTHSIPNNSKIWMMVTKHYTKVQ